jgi:hypothetical protein
VIEIKKRKVALALGVIMVLCVAVGYAVVTSLTVHQSGRVQMVKAYWDSNCTNPFNAVDWGDVFPDSVMVRSFFMKNMGSIACNVSMSTSNWLPAGAGSYIKTSWNRENEIISGETVLECTLSLTVFANISMSDIGAFSSNIDLNVVY